MVPEVFSGCTFVQQGKAVLAAVCLAVSSSGLINRTKSDRPEMLLFYGPRPVSGAYVAVVTALRTISTGDDDNAIRIFFFRSAYESERRRCPIFDCVLGCSKGRSID